MRLLLDTHIWLDFASSPGKLGRRLRRELISANSELWLSPISVWEALRLAEKGKLKSRRDDPATSIGRILEACPMREAAITFQIARETSMFALPHRDPADAWLVATARVMGLVLATRDEKITMSGLVETLGDD